MFEIGSIELLEQRELRPAESRPQVPIGVGQALDAVVNRPIRLIESRNRFGRARCNGEQNQSRREGVGEARHHGAA